MDEKKKRKAAETGQNGLETELLCFFCHLLILRPKRQQEQPVSWVSRATMARFVFLGKHDLPPRSLFLSLTKYFHVALQERGYGKKWDLRKPSMFIKALKVNFIIFLFPRRGKRCCFYCKYNWNQYLPKCT